MTTIAFWCGRTFLKARWNIEGIPCETDEEFEAALANSKNVRRVWDDGDNCFYEVVMGLDQLPFTDPYQMFDRDGIRYIKWDKPSKPKQSIQFWANDWRKKHKR